MAGILIEVNAWELAALLSKLLIYLSVIAPAGALVTLYLGREAGPAAIRSSSRAHILAYALVAMVTGLLAVCLFFLLEVGAINQQGLAGMLDRELAVIMAGTALGDGTRLRLLGFSLLLLALLSRVLPLFRMVPGHRRWTVSFALAGLLLLAASFARYGHVVNLPWPASIAIILHYLAIAYWIGSLYPLYALCRREPAEQLQPLMEQFGRIARLWLVVLLLSGVYLLWQLTEGFSNLLDSTYGWLLLGKLLLVSGLMGLGALNRYRLVPGLTAAGGKQRLQRSIALEMLLALPILLLTVLATTLFGPA